MTSSERPVFWVVGGPNGSGKSSLYGNTDIEAFDQSVWIINPDLLTQRIRSVEGLGERWTRSFAQLPWYLDQADRAVIFDNSNAVPRLIGRKQQDELVIYPEAPNALREALDPSRGADR